MYMYKHFPEILYSKLCCEYAGSYSDLTYLYIIIIFYMLGCLDINPMLFEGIIFMFCTTNKFLNCMQILTLLRVWYVVPTILNYFYRLL